MDIFPLLSPTTFSRQRLYCPLLSSLSLSVSLCFFDYQPAPFVSTPVSPLSLVKASTCRSELTLVGDPPLPLSHTPDPPPTNGTEDVAWTEGPNSSYLLGGWTGPFWRCCGLPGPRPQHVGGWRFPECADHTAWQGGGAAEPSQANVCAPVWESARPRARMYLCICVSACSAPRRENALLRPLARHTREPPWRPRTLILVP